MNDQAFELLMDTVRSTHKMIEKIENDSIKRNDSLKEDLKSFEKKIEEQNEENFNEIKDEIRVIEDKVTKLQRFKSKVLGFAGAISFVTTGATVKIFALPVDYQKKSIEKLINHNHPKED